ncbi:poly polymerase catalytic domain-containing protein [Microdochium trichocladiopsis]|uniref:Poly [ADP-ribose] polymerase n=1 Tax=Microdochium trichocladiopsis TaxID=1682393 RepID=A0A9P9BN06_9PEZI|nr:poly polymerase catalytic domain-containing protein [Microdochium trichocladiopsis]KAH7027233.1 poly polymerase catalytic domain-containing protein [Microdochium trichocladiopsis]
MIPEWVPDAPGTINPAKLVVRAAPLPSALPTPPPTPGISTSSTVGTDGSCPTTPHETDVGDTKRLDAVSRHTALCQARLPRISSEIDSGSTAFSAPLSSCRDGHGHDSRLEFEAFCGRKPSKVPARLSLRKQRLARHTDYFMSQMLHIKKLSLLVDPAAGSESNVVVEKSTHSIWDAYLLRADVPRNVNLFRRQQIIYNKVLERYILLVRDGCVGQLGHVSTSSREVLSAPSLRPVTTRFKALFKLATGKVWEQRYSEQKFRRRTEQYEFVELDYVSSRRASPPELPDYTWLNLTIVDEVRTMMDLILHGASAEASKQSQDSEQRRSWSSYTAPYQELSQYTMFLGFRILKLIGDVLEATDGSVKWKTMQRLTSRYRSQIPHCRGSAHYTPVISSYQALLLELRLLSSLWPEQQEISRALNSVCTRATMHWHTHGVLAQPLYQAYSSLRHGFRRLTDRSSLEYRELCQYLHGSNHPVHRTYFEVMDIYRVFIKSGLPNAYQEWIDSKTPTSDTNTVSTSGSSLNSDPQTSSRDAEDRRLLWHGTPLDSLLGILDLGLQIRRRGASFTGTMFGNGIYLADSSSKSAGFCRHHENANRASISGGQRSPRTGGAGLSQRTMSFGRAGKSESAEAVLLLCEADVGRNRLLSQHSIPQGHNVVEATYGRRRCIQGLGQNGPPAWKGVRWNIESAPSAKPGAVLMVSRLFSDE